MKSDSTTARGLSDRLIRYSSATFGGVIGTLASFESSEAALVVTPMGYAFTHSEGDPQQLAINLDAISGDGHNDVLVTIPVASILSAQGLAKSTQGLYGAELAGAMGSLGFYPTGFLASEVVDAGATFGGGQVSPFPTFSTFGTLAVESSQSTLAQGAWAGGAEKYLGVRFDTGGETFYGWVHIGWNPDTATATVISYAYEDVAGVGANVPECSSLALLALGAVGLGVRRRRKASK